MFKEMVKDTLANGIRFVSQQSKPTEGKRSVRLDSWFYVRGVSADDVLRAVRKSPFAGHFTEETRAQIRALMEQQKTYHVFVRGNDPRFMPPDDEFGQDAVTSYILERIEAVAEEVDKRLFDELSDPSAVKQAMSDSGFDAMLEAFFRSGDVVHEETLHVASRFRGGSNLLHTCIKEGYVDTLRLLLEQFTLESHGQEHRWRVLAEPLRPVGKFKVTAFHRAVFDGQHQCLQELVSWAQRHRHDITQLRNVEERSITEGAISGLTCLELADQERNYACYNLLAPLFGVEPKQEAVDKTTRFVRITQMTVPRVELEFSEHLTHIELTCFDWHAVVQAVKKLCRGDSHQSRKPRGLTVRLCCIAFVDDPSEEVVQELLSACAGMALETSGCMMKSDKTNLAFLKALVKLLDSETELPLPPDLPHKLDISCSVADALPHDEELAVDAQVSALVVSLPQLLSKWPGFLGARNGLITVTQRQRLSLMPDKAAFAASWAAVYCTRLHAFLSHDRDVDGGYEAWMRKRELMPFARAVMKKFFNQGLLLAREFLDPADAIDPAVIPFLKMTLSAWFSTFPRGSGDSWQLWAERLGADEVAFQQQLLPAMDLVLESLLRMWKVLNHACKRAASKWSDDKATSIGDLVRKCVPEQLLDRLPLTRDRLERHFPVAVSRPSQPSRPSLTSTISGVSLRPSWAQKI